LKRPRGLIKEDERQTHPVQYDADEDDEDFVQDLAIRQIDVNIFEQVIEFLEGQRVESPRVAAQRFHYMPREGIRAIFHYWVRKCASSPNGTLMPRLREAKGSTAAAPLHPYACFLDRGYRQRR
jgi:hypothetical protein